MTDHPPKTITLYNDKRSIVIVNADDVAAIADWKLLGYADQPAAEDKSVTDKMVKRKSVRASVSDDGKQIGVTLTTAGEDAL